MVKLSLISVETWQLGFIVGLAHARFHRWHGDINPFFPSFVLLHGHCHIVMLFILTSPL